MPEPTQATASKPKRKGLSRFLNFLMFGGWLIILIVGMAIFIGISILLNR